ncbi:MAG: hypothetical protein AAFS10_20915, partial [Myxococcota bacterium]
MTPPKMTVKGDGAMADPEGDNNNNGNGTPRTHAASSSERSDPTTVQGRTLTTSDRGQQHPINDPTVTPFRAHRLDPWQTPEALTEAFRELAEEADEEERRRLQGVWRQLTLKRDDQLRAALFAHAHPSNHLPDVEAMDTRQLVRTFRLGQPSRRTGSELPEVLRDPRPMVADLVVLPPLMLSGSAGAAERGAARPDVPP